MKYPILPIRKIVIRCCLSSVMLFQACDSSNDGVEYTNEFYGDAEIIRIDPKNDIDEEYSMKASLIVSSIDYYPLTLPEDMIIGEIEKMIHHNGHVYISDRLTESVFIFTDEGEFINAIQSKGEGPEEYGEINDFNVDPRTGNVLIHSHMSQKILTYAISGEYLSSMKNKLFISSFFPISDSSMALYNSRMSNGHIFENTFPVQPRFFIANESEEIEKQDLETTYREHLLSYPIPRAGFYQIGDSLRLMESINSVVYGVDLEEGSVFPRFAFEFTNANPPRIYDMDADELSIFLEDYKNKKVGGWAFLSNVSETEDFICAAYSYNGYNNMTFYSKRSNHQVNIGPVWINDMDSISMPMVQTVTADGEFVGYFNSNIFSRMVRNNDNKLSQKILDLEKSQRDAESIILVKFRLKDF